MSYDDDGRRGDDEYRELIQAAQEMAEELQAEQNAREEAEGKLQRAMEEVSRAREEAETERQRLKASLDDKADAEDAVQRLQAQLSKYEQDLTRSVLVWGGCVGRRRAAVAVTAPLRPF